MAAFAAKCKPDVAVLGFVKKTVAWAYLTLGVFPAAGGEAQGKRQGGGGEG
jgi:hypothetical protein